MNLSLSNRQHMFNPDWRHCNVPEYSRNRPESAFLDVQSNASLMRSRMAFCLRLIANGGDSNVGSVSLSVTESCESP
jgi:hypothetical protein